MNTCGVCYEDNTNKITCCKQLLCTHCITQLNKCPFCRQIFRRRRAKDETSRRWMAPHETEADYTLAERQLLNALSLDDPAQFARTLSRIRGYPF